MEIIFHENRLGESGTTVAMYDYAYYYREYFNINPIIVVPKRDDNCCLHKFNKEFEVIEYDNISLVQKLIDKKNVKYFYSIKFGIKDEILFKNCINLIHAVFFCHPWHRHGEVYAFVSEYLSKYKNPEIPYVPHMINLPDHFDDLREKLSIPKDVVVIGRYGSVDTFNIDFVKETIKEIIEKRKDIYFLFANTPEFISHPRVIYLPKIIDLYEKVKFINSCDAMIHARDYGETFGLAILEFACKNKQIISYDNEEFQSSHMLGGRNHFLYLKDNCFKYKDQKDLYNIFENISKNNPFDTLYLNQEYGPRNVMNKFKEVFLN